MAGAGYKLFTTGSVLTAADVNTYLNEQTVMVFNNATARTTALSGVLAEGMVSYLKDTNATEVYDGSAWVGIGNSGDITAVTAGTGISGGGTSGAVTITNSMATEITASGDIIVGTGSGTFDNLPIGTTGQVLTADTTVSPYKVKWASPSAASFVGCSVYNSSTQTFANNTETTINFDSEYFDTNGFHDNVTNNSRITIPTGYGGKYLISAANRWVQNTNGARNMMLYVNNVSVMDLMNLPGNAATLSYCFRSVIYTLAAGDYIQIKATQSSGGNLDMYLRTIEMPFSVQWLGA